MDCSVIDERLVAYHFGTCSDPEREEVDEHLLACGRCLRAYLDLKRQFDREGTAQRPRPEVRARLRASLEARFAPKGIDRIRGWLHHPVPRSHGLAAAAALAIAAGVLVAVLPATTRRPAPEAPVARAEAGERVDTARAPEGTTLY